MIKTNYYSFSSKINGNIHLNKNDIFKIVKIRDNICALDFENNLLFQIEPQTSDDKVLDYFNNIGENYASFSKLNKQKNEAIIDIHPIFKIEKISNFIIYSENDLKIKINIFEALGDKAIVLFNNIHSTDNSFYIESENTGKFYKIVEKQEYINDSDISSVFYELDGASYKSLKNLNEFQEILIYGNVEVTDRKTYLNIEDKIQLKKIQGDVKNYLNLWDKYNSIELEKEFSIFKAIGSVRYDFFFENHEHITLYFDEENYKKLKTISKDSMLMVGNNNFLDLFNCKDIEAYNKVEKDILSKKEATICYFKGKDAFNDVERSVRVGTNDLTFFQANSGIGYLGLSLLGNKISFDRREKAKEKIITGKSGITKLYTYFTDNPEPSEKREEITIDQRLIKKNLTPNQLEAVKIICNTPDIAIIQGPPGTGKTTTIKEALIQLNSNKENKYDFGNNLLSGFRHETVLNLTESIDLFGLPAVKIGRKSLDEDEEEIEPRILKFIDELVNTLLEKYKGLTIEDEEYIEFKKKYYAYVNFNNSIESSVAILNEVKNLNRFKYDMDVQDHLDELISKLNKKTNNTSIEVKDFLDFLYSFPLTKTAFKDEKDRIRTDLDCYKDYQELKKYAIALEKEIDNFDEKRIKVLRRELILKLRPVPSILIMKSEKDEIVDYLDSLFEMLKVERYKKFNGDKVAILDYIDSLMENPKLIKETLLDYTKVLGATNQQASSKNMALLKQDELLFDNVIIDEAATSSPLDLFIPMSLAKKRIILVGDHRQLPNITDDEIISNISKNIEVSEDSLEKIAKDMKTTLFEILMDKARLLEKKDGVKRVVTLNTQFRMHPELGNYVSNNFYKKDGGFNSPRPANEFEHNYHSLMNNYLRWIDVPFDDKEKYRLGSSRKNTPEAIKIAKHIKEALDIGNTLSIGVITIYREQVKEIKNQLIRVGVLNKNDTLTSQYANQELLIGTVDAFQGREFDIVYLSLAYVTKDIQREKNKFSRLAWANADSLLCVALSRQKRMLIVVGDINLYSSKECKDLVPSIYDLCDKCLGGGMYE